MDPLSPFFSRFSLSARVFFTGALCRNVRFDDREGVGHIHVLRSGVLKLADSKGVRTTLAEPAVIFFPGPSRHQLIASEATSPELVCASIEFGATAGNPLVRALPEVVILPLSAVDGLRPAIEMLFAEAHGQAMGRQVALDRLAEYFAVLLLRHALDANLMGSGLVAGLADPRLGKAIAALHDRPDKPWTLESLASAANMSRARFAARFRAVLGVTPLEYLTDWRIGVSQSLLRQGKPLKLVAPAVGYASATTLARVFARRLGRSPGEWLADRERRTRR